MYTKSMINVPFIKKLRKALLDTPAAYDQGVFKPSDANFNHSNRCADADCEMCNPKVKDCNTACCIAGHAFLLSGKSIKQLNAASHSTIRNTAAKAMGLTKDQTSVLFSAADEWPSNFAFDEDVSAKNKVKKAVAYLDAIVERLQLENKHPVLHMNLWERE